MGIRASSENFMSGTFFPSADEMRGMLAPVARDAEQQLGSRVTLFTMQPVRRPDGSYGPAQPVSTGDTHVPVKLKSVTLEIAQEIFGAGTDIRMTGKMARIITMLPGMILSVTEDDWEGQSFEVTKIIERPLSDSYVLGLKEHAWVI
jgi:hypothetical protein